MAAWREEEVDAARHRQEKREATRLGNGSPRVEFCEATPFGLVDESKESLYGRETDRNLRSGDASRFVFSSSERAVWEVGGGVRCQTIFVCLFPCSADHERDWPPCIVCMVITYSRV